MGDGPTGRRIKAHFPTLLPRRASDRSPIQSFEAASSGRNRGLFFSFGRVIVRPQIRYATGSQVPHRVPDLTDVADDHLPGCSGGVQDLVVSYIDAYVGWLASSGRKEYQISRLQIILADLFPCLNCSLEDRGSSILNLEKRLFTSPEQSIPLCADPPKR